MTKIRSNTLDGAIRASGQMIRDMNLIEAHYDLGRLAAQGVEGGPSAEKAKEFRGRLGVIMNQLVLLGEEMKKYNLEWMYELPNKES